MMMSPETFKKEHENDSYKELIKVREELLADIKEFEKNPGNTDAFMFPSPRDIYLFNLEYLEKLCGMIADKYLEEYGNFVGRDQQKAYGINGSEILSVKQDRLEGAVSAKGLSKNDKQNKKQELERISVFYFYKM